MEQRAIADARRAARKLLTQWGGTDLYIARQHRRISQLRRLATDSYDSVARHVMRIAPGRTHSDSSPVERAYEIADMQAEQYHRAAKHTGIQIAHALNRQRKVDERIEQLPALTQSVLRLRYVECLPWQTLAQRLQYNMSYVKRCENEALQALFPLLGHLECE